MTLSSLGAPGPPDGESIPAYLGHHPSVYAHIDARLEEHVEHLRRWIRQPSVSATGDGIPEMVAMLVDDLRQLGFQEVELVPTEGHPGVWAHYDTGASKTLMIYLMYDVQPADPDEWSSPPFDANLVEHELGSVLIGRGALDQKGPQRALLNALGSIIAVDGQLPVNIMVLAEGEEELGSPHYAEMVRRYEARLRSCDAVYMPFLSQDAGGALNLSLGVKGLLYFELEARGGPHGGPMRSDIAGPLKVLVDSPVWRLIHALASLTSDNGNRIAVQGYSSLVRDPSPEELHLAASMLGEWEQLEVSMRRQHQVARWIDDVRGPDSLHRYLFGTDINIDGIWAGWTEPGIKTVLPQVATAKLDVRLVPDQEPEAVVELLRRHLDDGGFNDIAIDVLAAYPSAQTSVDMPIVRNLIAVLEKYGHSPALAVRSSGSAPWYHFTTLLGLPLASGGPGHGGGAHAPDEYMVIDPKPEAGVAGLAEIEKAYVDLLYAFAESSA